MITFYSLTKPEKGLVKEMIFAITDEDHGLLVGNTLLHSAIEELRKAYPEWNTEGMKFEYSPAKLTVKIYDKNI